MIYSFHIFDRHCNCVFIRNFEHQSNTTASSVANPIAQYPNAPSGSLNANNDLDVSKLLFGMLYSLKSIAHKLGDDSGPLNELRVFELGPFRAHHWESQTGMKLVLVSDSLVDSLQAQLLNIYNQFYVRNLASNPLVSPEFDSSRDLTPSPYRYLSNPAFVRQVDLYLHSLPEFTKVA